MAIDDLDQILNKDAIIATYPVDHLASAPRDVETSYHTHARTHVSLGDTDKYVDTVFKWIGGGNQGAFVGAVVGDYGHGKTSFQIHLWSASKERKIFAVPPFQWTRESDLVDGVAAWIQYELGETHADLAIRARAIHEQFREKSLREVAEDTAAQTGQDVDTVYAMLQALGEAGHEVYAGLTVERYLDYCEEATRLIKEAGYSGLLVLLDEPEVAAKALGTARVSLVLFEIADGLHRRRGDYGVFVSMPENFLAQAQTSFASLPARLQACGCFPRLRDMYGSDFAHVLWGRYVKEFDLEDIARQVVQPATIESIGQVGSSDRNDLSYGPRTVVSAFRRMVYRYKQRNVPYRPEDFVADCIDNEVLVSNYPSRVLEALDAPEAKDIDRQVLLTIAAFPNGMTSDMVEELGLREMMGQLVRRPGFVYKRGNLFGLARLQKPGDIVVGDQLMDTLADIAGEFAPSPASLAVARDAFIDFIMPAIFEPRHGQQLLGWELGEKWKGVGEDTVGASLVGSFRQTEKDYPGRTVAVAVGPIEADVDRVFTAMWDTDDPPDIIIHFRMRWSKDRGVSERVLELDVGDAQERRPGLVRLVLNLADDAISHPKLAVAFGKELLSSFEVLYAVQEKQKRQLSREYEAEWSTIKALQIRDVLVQFLGDEKIRALALEQIGQPIPGDALAVLGSVCRFILKARYPDYSTLIRQPQWDKKINEYLGVLSNANIPLSCKRGRASWSAEGNDVARAFNTSVMNLRGGAFDGFENLLSIDDTGEKGILQVTFKLHPQEQTISDLITQNNPRPKRKFDGKECWYVPVDDVTSMMLVSGYTSEELVKIVEIGKARGSFEGTRMGNQLVLYCKPLDIDQMKAHLKEKLADLETEMAEFGKLPEFTTRFDSEATMGSIVELQDEADYDRILMQMNRQFELMHSHVPKYFESLSTDIGGLRNKAVEWKRDLKDSRGVAGIQNPPKGTARWCADLSNYVVAALRTSANEIYAECDGAAANANKAATECRDVPGKGILERVQLLLSGYDALAVTKARLDSIETKSKTLDSYLKDYEKWVQLVSKSDEVHNHLLELKKESAHESKAKELNSQLEVISDDISRHLKTRNVTGLGSHKQFYEQLEKLDEERRKYISGLRTAFGATKKELNDLLEEVDLGADYRCNEIFNPDDIQGCYLKLYQEAVALFDKAVSAERRGVESQYQELMYAREILGQIPEDQAESAVTALDSAGEALTSIAAAIDVDWVQLLMGEKRDERQTIKDSLRQSREAVRSSRMLTAQAQGPKESELTADAQQMLVMIPEGSELNLKQLILQMMEGGMTPSEVLGASLACLAELFRNGKVQITVERSRK